MCRYNDSQINVLQHYNQQHDIDISIEYIKFNNFDEFKKWKDETENTNISKYIRYGSMSDAKIHYYSRCHRDGFYESCEKNIRHLKIMGKK